MSLNLHAMYHMKMFFNAGAGEVVLRIMSSYLFFSSYRANFIMLKEALACQPKLVSGYIRTKQKPNHEGCRNRFGMTKNNTNFQVIKEALAFYQEKIK